jgi:hypothetical protein
VVFEGTPADLGVRRAHARGRRRGLPADRAEPAFGCALRTSSKGERPLDEVATAACPCPGSVRRRRRPRDARP